MGLRIKKSERLRPTEGDENGSSELCYPKWGAEEVVTALEKSRPPGSLIRIARFELINVSRPTDEEGR